MHQLLFLGYKQYQKFIMVQHARKDHIDNNETGGS